MPDQATRRHFILWTTTVAWTALVLFLMVSPGEDTAADELSGFFGGSELSDAVGHVVLFAVLTVLWQRALRRHTTYRRALAVAVAIGLLIGVATEIAQLYIPHRGGGAVDILADSIGVALATAFIGSRRS